MPLWLCLACVCYMSTLHAVDDSTCSACMCLPDRYTSMSLACSHDLWCVDDAPLLPAGALWSGHPDSCHPTCPERHSHVPCEPTLLQRVIEGRPLDPRPAVQTLLHHRIRDGLLQLGVSLDAGVLRALAAAPESIALRALSSFRDRVLLGKKQDPRACLLELLHVAPAWGP